MGFTHVDAARQRLVGADGKLTVERLSNYGPVSTYTVEKTSEK